MQEFLHRELASGNWPTWNPYAFGGMPFAGEPQSGVFYPPALVANGLFAPTGALIALCLFHYGIALLGTYLLCRRRGLAVAPSTYAALAYGVSGLLLSRTQALTLLAGAAWLPVCLWAAQRAGGTRRLRDAALLGACLAFQVAAGAQQVALVTALACAALLVLRLRRDAPIALLVTTGTAIALAMPLLLSVLQLTGRSAAAGGIDQHGFGALEWANLKSLYGNAGPVENEGGPLYTGILTPALALVAVVFCFRRVRDLAALGAGAVIWAAGAAGVVAVALAPALATLTAHQPVRALPLFLLALAVAAATWLSNATPPTRLQIAAVLLVGAVLALGLDFDRDLSWRAGLAFAATAACLVALGVPRLARFAPWLLIAVLALDLASVDYRIGNPHQPPPDWQPIAQTFPSAPPTARFLLAQEAKEGPFRFANVPSGHMLQYQLRYGRNPLAQDLLMDMAGTRCGLEDVSGYDPLLLADYRNYMAVSNGRLENRHFVNVLRPLTRELRALGVRYYLLPSTRPPLKGYPKVFDDGLVSIYRDPKAMPLARLAGGSARITSREADRTVVRHQQHPDRHAGDRRPGLPGVVGADRRQGRVPARRRLACSAAWTCRPAGTRSSSPTSRRGFRSRSWPGSAGSPRRRASGSSSAVAAGGTSRRGSRCRRGKSPVVPAPPEPSLAAPPPAS